MHVRAGREKAHVGLARATGSRYHADIMAEGEGGDSIIETIFVSIFNLVVEMIGAILGALPKIIKFIVWALLAVIILPCVFVAGSIYPWWAEWGEEF